MIPFNKPYLTGKETDYIIDAVKSGHISGNGKYTKLCQNYFQEKFGFKKCLLTTSCTDALEMAALLLEIKPGDEIIIPSFTFVSSALAFVRQGAKIVFADSRNDHPGIDESKIEALITGKTKAVIVVHYAGVACDMDLIMEIANRYHLFVVEDAAQAINSCYKEKPLGSIGHLGCFSFHETKNIQCGEGGMLAINDEQFIKRAEIIWEKGTNRAAFFRGEIDKYGWVDIGSSFLPSDILAAFLLTQLEQLEKIQKRRTQIWDLYNNSLKQLQSKQKPIIPYYATNNAHMYYLICNNLLERDNLITELKENNIYSVFHYQALHNSEYYKNYYSGEELYNSLLYSNNLIRLPFFMELSDENIKKISEVVNLFYKK